MINGRRVFIYVIGLFILAFGITMNTKTGLGVSPIISIAYNVSQITGVKLGIMSFIFYALMVVIQLILLGKDFKPYQFLQIAVSLLTSVFIQFYDNYLPMLDSLPARYAGLAIAIIATGIGASLTVGMKIVPNPADGLASVIGQKLHKNFGFGKNFFDIVSLCIALTIGFVFTGHILGIGIGTICAMIFTGRVIALLQKTSDHIYEWTLK